MQPIENIPDSRDRQDTAATGSAVRVLLVIGDLAHGGAERQVVTLVNGLHNHGIDAHVATFSGVVPLAADLAAADRLHILPGRSLPALVALIGRLRPRIVHGFLLDAEILACLASRLQRGVLPFGSERSTRHRYPAWQSLLYRLATTNMTRCIANSDEGMRWHSEHFRRARATYRVVRNGIDTNRFHPGSGTSVRHQLGIGGQDFVIGMFASYKAVKNHPLLLTAAAGLVNRGVNLKVLLVGGGVARGAAAGRAGAAGIESRVRSLGLERQVITLSHRSDPEALYRACDVTVLPSSYEGTPNVVLESMASAVPAVVADVPGCREVAALCPALRVFQPGDVEHLVSVLAGLYTHRAQLPELGRLCRTQVERHYSEAAMLAAMAAAYREAVAGG